MILRKAKITINTGQETMNQAADLDWSMQASIKPQSSIKSSREVTESTWRKMSREKCSKDKTKMLIRKWQRNPRRYCYSIVKFNIVDFIIFHHGEKINKYARGCLTWGVFR